MAVDIARAGPGINEYFREQGLAEIESRTLADGTRIQHKQNDTTRTPLTRQEENVYNGHIRDFMRDRPDEALNRAKAIRAIEDDNKFQEEVRLRNHDVDDAERAGEMQRAISLLIKERNGATLTAAEIAELDRVERFDNNKYDTLRRVANAKKQQIRNAQTIPEVRAVDVDSGW